MAAKFNIVAELLLQGPKNVRSVVKDIRSQLSSIQTDVSVRIDPKATREIARLNKQIRELRSSSAGSAKASSTVASNLAQIEGAAGKASTSVKNLATESQKTGKSLKGVSSDVAAATGAIEEFGRQSGLAVKRFLAFSIPTSILLGFTVAIKKGFQGAIDFERELIKISQVTGRTVQGLSELRSEITRLATTFGVSSQELLETSRVLSQAGLSARETKTALEALAKASLAPTFRDMQNTVEGSIAALNQFGFGVDQLEAKLGSINAVAGAFAVEAEDIVFAIRRTGGAFKAAGGDLEELISLFTAVRSTTRESAETIATGFRTIFTRIQRPQTIAFLDELGIKLRDAKGQFIGPLESIKKLNQALAEVPPTDARFAQIVEEIGGYRQVSKVIPLIREMNTALAAQQVALSGTDSLAQDAAVAQDALAVQLVKTKEEFAALIRSLGDDSNIRGMAEGALKLASSFIQIVDAAKPVLPILAAVGGFKAASGAIQFGRGFLGGISPGGGNDQLVSQQNQLMQQEIAVERELVGTLRATQQQEATSSSSMNSLVNSLNNLKVSIDRLASTQNTRTASGLIIPGAAPIKRARGGYVPGSGNRDTVPALLTPGEFVIRKSAAKALGSGTLNNMNRYAKGGVVNVGSAGKFGGLFLEPEGGDEAARSANYAGPLQASGIIANKINAAMGLRGGVMKGTKRAPGQDITLTGAMFNKSKTDTFIGVSRFDLRDRLAQDPTFNNPKGQNFLNALGKSANKRKLPDINLQPGMKKAFFANAFALGANFDFGGVGVTAADFGKGGITLTGAPGIYRINPSIHKNMIGHLHKAWRQMLINTVGAGGESFVDQNFNNIYTRAGAKSVEGHAFEAMLLALGQDPNFSTASNEAFDFTGGSGFATNVAGLFSQAILGLSHLDAKRSAQNDSAVASLVKKAANSMATGQMASTMQFTPTGELAQTAASQGISGPIALNTGGFASGTDTVPALLTPGEFVINKKSASRIGSSNLQRMNKFAKGGFVPGAPVQRFAEGGFVGKIAAAGFTASMVSSLATMGGEVDKTTQKITELATMFSTLLITSTMLNDFSIGTLATQAAERAASQAKTGSELINAKATDANTGSEVLNTGSTLENTAAQFANSKALKGFSIAAQASQVAALAVSAAFYMAASSAKDAAQAQLDSAENIKEATGAAAGLAQAAEDEAGAIGQGIGAIGGAKIGASIGKMFGPIGTAVGGIIGTIGGALAGDQIGKLVNDEEKAFKAALEKFRERVLGENIDSFSDIMSDINSKRATIEGKSLQIRESLNRNEEILAQAESGERDKLIRQLKGQISTYFSIGQSIAGTTESLEEFKKANRGLGTQLIESIADLRGLPISDVENMFKDMIDQRKKSEKATEALIRAEEAAALDMKKFQDLADGLDLAANAAARFAGDFDTIISLVKGDFVTGADFIGPQGFNQIGNDFTSIVNPREFSEALKAITTPFGAVGEELQTQATLQAQAARRLPDILKEARAQVRRAGGGDETIAQIVRQELGDFPTLLKDVILKGIDDQLSEEQGRKKLFESIRKDPAAVAAELMGETLESMQAVLPQIRDAFVEEMNRLAKANADKTRLEIEMMDRRVQLLKQGFEREKELSRITGGKVDFKQQDLETQFALLGERNRGLANNAEGVAKRLLQVRRDIADTSAAIRRSGDFDQKAATRAFDALGAMQKEASGLSKTLKLLGDSNRGLIQAIREEVKSRQEAQDKIVEGVEGFLGSNQEGRASRDNQALQFAKVFKKAANIKLVGDDGTPVSQVTDLGVENNQLQEALKFAKALPEISGFGKRDELVQRILAEQLFLLKSLEDPSKPMFDRTDALDVKRVSQLVGQAQTDPLSGAIKQLEGALTAAQKAGFIELNRVQGQLFTDLVKEMEGANERFLIRFEQILIRQSAREIAAEAKVLKEQQDALREQRDSAGNFVDAVQDAVPNSELVKALRQGNRDDSASLAKVITGSLGDLQDAADSSEVVQKLKDLVNISDANRKVIELTQGRPERQETTKVQTGRGSTRTSTKTIEEARAPAIFTRPTTPGGDFFLGQDARPWWMEALDVPRAVVSGFIGERGPEEEDAQFTRLLNSIVLNKSGLGGSGQSAIDLDLGRQGVAALLGIPQRQFGIAGVAGLQRVPVDPETGTVATQNMIEDVTSAIQSAIPEDTLKTQLEAIASGDKEMRGDLVRELSDIVKGIDSLSGIADDPAAFKKFQDSLSTSLATSQGAPAERLGLFEDSLEVVTRLAQQRTGIGPAIPAGNAELVDRAIERSAKILQGEGIMAEISRRDEGKASVEGFVRLMTDELGSREDALIALADRFTSERNRGTRQGVLRDAEGQPVPDPTGKQKFLWDNILPLDDEQARRAAESLIFYEAQLRQIVESGLDGTLALTATSAALSLVADQSKKAEEKLKKSMDALKRTDTIKDLAAETGKSVDVLIADLIQLAREGNTDAIAKLAEAAQNVDEKKFKDLNSEILKLSPELDSVNSKLKIFTDQLVDLDKQLVLSETNKIRRGAGAVSSRAATAQVDVITKSVQRGLENARARVTSDNTGSLGSILNALTTPIQNTLGNLSQAVDSLGNVVREPIGQIARKAGEAKPVKQTRSRISEDEQSRLEQQSLEAMKNLRTAEEDLNSVKTQNTEESETSLKNAQEAINTRRQLIAEVNKELQTKGLVATTAAENLELEKKRQAVIRSFQDMELIAPEYEKQKIEDMLSALLKLKFEGKDSVISQEDLQALNEALRLSTRIQDELRNATFPARGDSARPQMIPGFRTGGLLSNIFKARGTDTVPAMLTPGEFVINRDATKKNLNLLKAINSGTVFAANGGIITPTPLGAKAIYKDPRRFDRNGDKLLSSDEVYQMMVGERFSDIGRAMLQFWNGERDFAPNGQKSTKEEFRKRHINNVNRAFSTSLDRQRRGVFNQDRTSSLFATEAQRKQFELLYTFGLRGSAVSPLTGKPIDRDAVNRATRQVQRKITEGTFDPKNIFADASQLYTANRMFAPNAYREWLSKSPLSDFGRPFFKSGPNTPLSTAGLYYNPVEFMRAMDTILFGGQNPLQFIQALGRRTGRFAKGGAVDNIPAYLSRGEFVVNRRAASDNMGLLQGINSGRIRGYNKGGLVGYMQNGGSVNRAGFGLLGGQGSPVSLDDRAIRSIDIFNNAALSIKEAFGAATPTFRTMFSGFEDSVESLQRAFSSFTGELNHTLEFRGSVNVDITGATGLITREMEQNLQEFGKSMAQAEVRKLVERMSELGMFGEGANALLRDLT